MKKINVLRSTLAALSLAFLGACSTSQYTFAPGTGSYHETLANKPVEQKAEPLALADADTEINASDAGADIITSPKAEAASALAQTLAANKNLKTSENAVASGTKTDKKAARDAVKQLKKDVKVLKKKVKDTNGSGLSSSVKLLIILGLIFIVLGLILPYLAVIGLILLLIGLILLLMDIL
jgi:hypothetical protein